MEALNTTADIQCAVTHRNLHGCALYFPGQAFTVKEPLDNFTKAGAYASFEEHAKGQIKPGQYADFVVLCADSFHSEPDKLKDNLILQTWMDDKRVW